MVTNLGIRRLAAQDIPEMRKLFRATVLTVNSKDYIGALDGQGGIVGFSSMNAEGYLHSMFVHKDWQGKSVATLLLSEVKKSLVDTGCTK